MNVAAAPGQSSVVHDFNAHSIGQCITASHERLLGLVRFLLSAVFAGTSR